MEHDSDRYQTTPNTDGAIITKLFPIGQDLEGREAKQEEVESCVCGAEEHSILVSDTELTIVKNKIPIYIQVECSLPEDHVMSAQHTICSSSSIHSSCPHHIAGVGV